MKHYYCTLQKNRKKFCYFSVKHQNFLHLYTNEDNVMAEFSEIEWNSNFLVDLYLVGLP